MHKLQQGVVTVNFRVLHDNQLVILLIHSYDSRNLEELYCLAPDNETYGFPHNLFWERSLKSCIQIYSYKSQRDKVIRLIFRSFCGFHHIQ